MPFLASTVLRTEGKQWVDSNRPADRSALLDFTTHVRLTPNPEWDLQLGLRLNVDWQQGGKRDQWEAEAEFDESFVRYRSAAQRMTLGAQRIHWGQMDFRSPTNQLASYDRRHFPFGDRSEQLPVPALRWEHFGSSFDTEVLLLPRFRASRLPKANDPWFPVDRTRGLIAGVDLDPALAPWLAIATITDDPPSGSGGAGIRLRRSTPQIDYSLSLQRSRRSLAYYELGPEIPAPLRGAFARGEVPQSLLDAIAERGAAAVWEDLAGEGTPLSIRARYPYATILGGDLAWSWQDMVWRAEAAWISDVPATTAQLDYTTVPGVAWAVAVETFPFDSEVRFNLQVSGDHRLDNRELLDSTHAYTLSGTLERYWQRQRWRTRLRYLVGAEPSQTYLNPQIAYLGVDAQELYAEVYWFDGAREAPIGYFRHNDFVMLGWRIQFN